MAGDAENMIKEFTMSVVTTAIGLVFLGLVGVCMARDTFKELNVGPFDE